MKQNVKTLDLDNTKYETEVAEYDLNDDIELEYIVRTKCKSDECPMSLNPSLIAHNIYDQVMFKDLNGNAEYKQSMLSIGGFQEEIKIINTKHDWYYDIKLKCDPKGNKYVIFIYDAKYHMYSSNSYC